MVSFSYPLFVFNVCLVLKQDILYNLSMRKQKEQNNISKITNADTAKAFKEAEEFLSGKRKLKKYSSTKELREDLNV